MLCPIFLVEQYPSKYYDPQKHVRMYRSFQHWPTLAAAERQRQQVKNAYIHNTDTLCHCAAYPSALSNLYSLESFSISTLSSLSHRLPPTSPSTLSIVGAGASSSSSSGERCRLTRGSTIRSTFHGGSAPWPCPTHLWTSAHVAHPQPWCWSPAPEYPQPGHF